MGGRSMVGHNCWTGSFRISVLGFSIFLAVGARADNLSASHNGIGVKIDSAIYGKLSGHKTKASMQAGTGIYLRNKYCDATNYFRLKREFVEHKTTVCIDNTTGLLSGAPCKDDADSELISEFWQRGGNALSQICRVEIDPRKMCGGYVPAETEERIATIRYRCSEQSNATGPEAKVWQVSPLKRDKEVAYLICPSGNRPKEYIEASKEPIPTEH